MHPGAGQALGATWCVPLGPLHRLNVPRAGWSRALTWPAYAPRLKRVNRLCTKEQAQLSAGDVRCQVFHTCNETKHCVFYVGLRALND